MKIRHVKYGFFVSGHTYGQDVTTVLEKLEQAGVNHVYCVSGQPDKDLQSVLGDHYHHHPLPDGNSVDDSVVTEIARSALDKASEGVLIHCRAGRNRSCLVIARVLSLLGHTADDIFDIIETARPNALANLAFREYIRGLD